SAGAGTAAGKTDLADRISMISRHDLEISSAIIKTVEEAEGSRILARPEQAGTGWLRSALANLSIMYEAIQAGSHIPDPHPLLERIMELIFRSIAADRGCIMLRDPDTGELIPTAARWRQEPGPQERLAVSRTVMEYVLHEKQGVLVSDATNDDRFSTVQSIVR